MKLSRYRQKKDYTCGPACMKVVLDYFGIKKEINELVKELKTTKKRGTDNAKMIEVIKKNKLKYVVKANSRLADIERFLKDYLVVVGYFIPYYQESHYAIVKKIDAEKIYFHDTWFGSNHQYKISYFLKNWWDEEEKRWLLAIKKPHEN